MDKIVKMPRTHNSARVRKMDLLDIEPGEYLYALSASRASSMVAYMHRTSQARYLVQHIKDRALVYRIADGEDAKAVKALLS